MNNKNKKDNKNDINLPMDYNIKSNKVRLVEESNSTIIMSRDDAIKLAKDRNMNLVQIAFNPSILPGSICKIIDYAKFKYNQKKKQKEQQKKNRANKTDIKEIDFSIRIDDNDKKIKINHAKEFLKNGNLVKICVILEKRELDKTNLAKLMFKSILNEFEGLALLEGNIIAEGRSISCILKRV